MVKMIAEYLYNNFRYKINFEANKIILSDREANDNPIWNSKTKFENFIISLPYQVILDFLFHPKVYDSTNRDISIMVQKINMKMQQITINKMDSLTKNMENITIIDRKLIDINEKMTDIDQNLLKVNLKIKKIKNNNKKIIEEIKSIKDDSSDKFESIESALGFEKYYDDPIMESIKSLRRIVEKIDTVTSMYVQTISQNVEKIDESLAKTHDSIMILGDVMTMNKS